MAEYVKRWKKKGKKIIFMPQAFGPFRSKNNRKYMKEIIENSDLIYARDDYSYEALTDILNNARNVKKAPDFTILLKGEIPSYFDRDKHQICIIPNKRMLDKMNDSTQYINVLTKSINYIQKNILNPFFLIQGGKEDLELAREINKRLETKIPIINEENPIYVKGIIQNSLGLVGSRFHSIASALYAAKVAIGTGWTHKYEYLYKEFDFVEGFINLKIEDEKLYKTLGLFIDENKREYIREKLIVKSKDIEKQAIQMFDEIKTIVGFKNENSAHSRR
jgi:colanic acid/amylovoran biosynthesis protein